MDLEMAKLYAENIINVLHKGTDAPITKVHAQRILTHALPPLMPKAMVKDSIHTFDPVALNAQVKKTLGPTSPTALSPIRVERIATCMGCVLTTCVVEVDLIPTLTNSLISWAKPIIEANANKTKVCTEWRMKLEADGLVKQQLQQQQVTVVASPASSGSTNGMSTESSIRSASKKAAVHPEASGIKVSDIFAP